ncbi:diguanylate cyclase [Gottschalkia acidurici 9a]|uniref:Diguanylate cyclase n=1 Tax=Gottschalkia acidurici (strain ATCC 7906 / DSM 604 / BCRC 14475 / CIP 104303 / KCTC 5404 / NCIMB 10678 / 9a) TaxID=1128398 RepID=K0AYD5_GOTA9|nr:diguanylate cyclase [Gottschalkia acidurici]AFS78269.1 diguanylate cyclase [Gottschalkia acidurici 9a]
MISDLFINGCILISILFILNEFLNFKDLNPSSSIKKKFISGVVYGFLSIILMIYNIKVNREVFFDFRHIPQVISAIYGGPVSVIVTGAISSIFYLIYLGISYNSIITSISIIINSIGCAFILYFHTNQQKKWIYMIIYSLVIRTIVLIKVLDSETIILKDIVSLWFGTIFITIIVYLLLDYIYIGYKNLKDLKKEANTDFLTNLNNSRGFNALLKDTLELAKKENINFSILMIDVDFFKQINDTYGHPSGDEILKQLGLIFNNISRYKYDVGRVGGEEFCILLRHCSKSQTLRFAEKIRSIVENHVFILSSGVEVKITVSVGVASYNETVSDIYKVKAYADEKLYEAKNTGRNKICS